MNFRRIMVNILKEKRYKIENFTIEVESIK